MSWVLIPMPMRWCGLYDQALLAGRLVCLWISAGCIVSSMAAAASGPSCARRVKRVAAPYLLFVVLTEHLEPGILLRFQHTSKECQCDQKSVRSRDPMYVRPDWSRIAHSRPQGTVYTRRSSTDEMVCTCTLEPLVRSLLPHILSRCAA
jgi:hypothetical protein